jgi:hypothetical protein
MMSDNWDDFWRYYHRWQASGDRVRLAMADLIHEGFRWQETDPERSFATFTRGRDEAIRLDEPWWVLFFEDWRLTALTSYVKDYTRALPLAMELMVKLESPIYRNHDWRNGILTDVLYTYVRTDPVGFQAEIERGFRHLDAEIPPGPVVDRHVLLNRQRTFLIALERWQEAFDQAEMSLALVDQDPEESTHTWYNAWILFDLCEICHALDKPDLVIVYAEHLAEVSKHGEQLRRTLAWAWCWRAVAERTLGDNNGAIRSLHKGVQSLNGLECRDEICANPIAIFHELAGEVRTALTVRDRELACIVGQGWLHRESGIHLQRCRLLSTLGELTQSDVDAAHLAVAKLRVPERFLGKLATIVASK